MSEREILFRGKKKNGEWIKGSLLKANFEGEDYNFIFGDKFGFTDDGGMKALSHALVIPETVGQYTGLKDRNGTRIFEGDIVNCNYFCGVVYFYEGAWCVSEKDKYPEDLYDLISLEVIGNIHDNPELLEGEDNG